ncbi:Uncharacterized protein FKW44_008036 [Caligus rogercresseyi]|uniref:Uncharacterized protein n=1 Tax=Caligus rogercresseyi TaxID=217165 RepID=A0A7T8QU09_CALRO|nr:Uncharacterized protein FKW44_008036 [Caligus rogercresseyi]
MTTLKPDTPDEVLEAKEDLLKSTPPFSTLRHGSPCEQAHAHPHDRCGRREKPKPCLVSRPALIANLVPRSNGNVHGGYQHQLHPTLRGPERPLRLTPPSPGTRKLVPSTLVHPQAANYQSGEPLPSPASTSSYKGPHRAPTPLWLQGYNYSPRTPHS